MATSLSPLQRNTSFKELEERLELRLDSTLDELVTLSRNAFRHDLWQRQNNPSYNSDPYRSPAYTFYFFFKDFADYVKSKSDITITKEDTLFLCGILYSALERQHNLDGYANEILSKITNSGVKKTLQSLMEGCQILLCNQHLRSISVSNSSEMGISLMILVALGSMTEIVLDQVLQQIGKTPEETLNGKIAQLTQTEPSGIYIVSFLFRWIKDHRNRIHSNVILKSDSVKLNYNVTRLIYLVFLTIFRIILNDMNSSHPGIDFPAQFGKFDHYHIRMGVLY